MKSAQNNRIDHTIKPHQGCVLTTIIEVRTGAHLRTVSETTVESMRTSGYQTSADCRSDDDSRSQSPCPDDYSTQYDNYSRDHGTFQHRDRERSSFTQRPWSGHDAHGMTLSNGTNNSRCQNCAKPHMASDRCPARGTLCGNCGKLNHWKAACRSALSYSGFATRTDFN